ncbi:MAG: hypothetical protein ACXWLC_00645 [Rhizomicrobium sp.]
MISDALPAQSKAVRLSTWRDVQRDWESWSLGERIAMAFIASSIFTLLSLIHWFGAA